MPLGAGLYYPCRPYVMRVGRRDQIRETKLQGLADMTPETANGTGLEKKCAVSY